MKIAKVAVLINTQKRRQLYDYLVPVELIDYLKVGTKVTVPFGGRPVHGFIFAFASSSEYEDLKTITDVETEELWLTPLQIKLAQALSDYYLAPLAQVLNTMIPAPFQGRYRLYYYPETDYPENTPLVRPLALEVHRYLVQKGNRVSQKELLNRFGPAVLPAVAELVSKGLAMKVHELSAGSLKPKKVKAYQVKKTPVDDVDLTILQERVLQALASQSRPQPFSAIRQNLGVSRSVIQALVDKGYLQETQLTQDRTPWELSDPTGEEKRVSLTSEQTEVLQGIVQSLQAGRYCGHLIHGVTGSGKTEIYKRAALACLKQGKSAIILVPEISLTPQMASEFSRLFGDKVAVLHSRLSAGERFDQWNKIRSGEARVVLGARSAVFAPVSDLGLVVVDEMHESSYKQGDAPYYHAVDAAEILAKICGAVLVLGSATPDVARYYRAGQGEYHLHTLTKRVGGGRLPEVRICDMRQELKAGNRSIFSRELYQRMKVAFTRGEQVILFLNRRGYASFLLCRSCGHVIKCPNCQVSMTVHKARPRLSCHYCEAEAPLPTRCPTCGSSYIRDFGVGTERVEREVRRLFPGVSVARLDSDATTQKGKVGKILSAFRRGEISVLVGTQMVAKGLDFPNVTLVGVIAADITLNLPDYTSAERTFQLVSQVAGRAGRGNKPGSVVVQSYNPEHYSIQAAARHDYEAFYQEELAYRRRLNYPPFYDMLLVSISSPDDQAALKAGEKLEAVLRGRLSQSAVISPLHPSPIPKLRNRYRYQLMLRWPVGSQVAADKEIVYQECASLPGTSTQDVRVGVNVDPISVL
ncbi:MAG: primosomal protein N' [Firmicutes bacterium]|nr:primosomal protein N' [Bacillota bacterium]